MTGWDDSNRQRISFNVMQIKFKLFRPFVVVLCFMGITVLGDESTNVVEKYGPVPTEIGAQGEDKILLLAIRSGDTNTLSSLLNAGKDPNTRINIEYTWGEISSIEEKQNPNDMSGIPRFKVVWRNLKVYTRQPTLLETAIRASQFAIVKLLIDRGADVNLPNTPGKNTPLMYASMQRESRIVELLIHKGAHVTSTNTAGESAMLLAKRAGQSHNIQLLVKAGASE